MKESYVRTTSEGKKICYAVEYDKEERGVIKVFRSTEQKKIRVKCGSTPQFIKEKDCITAPGGASGLYKRLVYYMQRNFCPALICDTIDFAIDQMKEV